MKKAARYILFFGILLILIICAGFIFTPHNYDPDSCDNDITKNWLGEEPDTIEMIVLGDSECYTSLEPNSFRRKTDINTFLCSSSGQRLADAYHVLKEVLETQSPDILLMETDMFYPDSTMPEIIKSAVVEEAESLMPFFEYHGRWKYLTPDVIAGKTGTSDPLKGFRVYTKVQPYEGGEYMTETDQFREMDPVSRHYLERIKELCDEKGISIVLMSSPSPKNWTYEKHNTTAKWADDNNIPFYDLNLKVDEIGLDWQTDSLDGGDHMNYSGARKTTSYMADIFNSEIKPSIFA